MRIDFALSDYREGAPQQITMTAGKFSVTPDGLCSIGRDGYWVMPILLCKAASGEPAYAAHMDPMNTTCSLPDPTWPNLQIQRDSGNPEQDFGGGAGLVPVQPFSINFGAADEPGGVKALPILCPGTKFSLAPLTRAPRYRIETEIQQIHLKTYTGYRD
jgi:hypothetical protein